MADPDEEGAEEVDREEEAERDVDEEAGDDVPPRVPRDAALVGAALAAGRPPTFRPTWSDSPRPRHSPPQPSLDSKHTGSSPFSRHAWIATSPETPLPTIATRFFFAILCAN